MSGYRCNACGNKTRFDVFESKRVRSFVHLTLGGDPTVEEEEVLERSVEKVVCRWCGSTDDVVHEPALYAEEAAPRGSG
ncbi:MAG: hypothetical protein M3345_05550 [Actinomycetota bacterium]|nr:hypothetical protein [Actinomycetota bacterium]